VAGSEDDDLHLMPSSPCINAGDPDFVADPVDEDIDGDPRIFNCRVDMGADETLVALPGDGDLDGSGMTDVDDIPPMVDLLLGRGNPDHECAADLNGDGVVNGLDIQFFVAAMF
ncbi:MAG: hypothetical protein O7F76_09535, partial [Planctomycetota bacterium]|nr:hypothetical protein [Planctomycetota bacterium]